MLKVLVTYQYDYNPKPRADNKESLSQQRDSKTCNIKGLINVRNNNECSRQRRKLDQQLG